MVERVDALLGELAARHGNQPEFLDRLRPMVERILQPDTPEQVRPELLEMVAETCERQISIERNAAEMREGIARLFDLLRSAIRDDSSDR